MLKQQQFRQAGRQGGFTLIELIVVMAISSSLLVIVFAGQQQLRSRAQFDAQINKLAASVANARTEATAGVNIFGAGDGTNGCAGGPAGQYVFGGVTWTVNNAAPNFVTMDYYKVLPGAFACRFQSQVINVSGLTISQVNGGAGSAAKLFFVRNDKGGLVICQTNSLVATVETNSFRSGACAAGSSASTLTLRLGDVDSHVSDISIDRSGLARRMN